MKHISHIFILLAVVFTALTISCKKPKKQTRTGPLVSLKYNGVYYESYNTAISIYRFETLTGTGYKTGYHFDIPVADYFIQNKIWADSVTSHNYTDTLLESSMVWQLGTYWFAWNSFNVKVDSVSGSQAFGTFSGYLVKLQSPDTLFITAGQFNHIPVIY